MAIVCGTDFSEHAARGVTAAAALSVRVEGPLHLVHSLDLGSSLFDEATREAYVNEAKSRLEQEAARARALGAEVETYLESGPADDVLLGLANETSASLIVIAAYGARRSKIWPLGSHAERLLQRTEVPVLVVRDPTPFEAWARGERQLHVMLGAERSISSGAAMQWVSTLRKHGPCDVTVVHIYWPPAEHKRLGLRGVRNYLEPDPEVQTALERELYEFLRAQDAATATPHTSGPDTMIPASDVLRLRVEPSLGRVGDRIAKLADELAADVIVVGARERSSLARLWEGSVSHDTVLEAHVSVICVPSSLHETTSVTPTTTPHVRTVVAATDFSAVGNAAIPLAYSVVEPGGTVHLLHVMPRRDKKTPVRPKDDCYTAPSVPDTSEERGVLEQRLLHLLPLDALGENKATQLHVIESSDPAQAIAQAAERLHADVLCVGSRGRSGLSKVVLGSVAQSLLGKTRKPVLISQPAP